MSRVQLALNVSHIDAAVDVCSKLFDAEPSGVPDRPALLSLSRRSSVAGEHLMNPASVTHQRP